MSTGWTKIHRKILESDLWLQEKFTRGQAWLDLILLANHKDGFYRVNGKRIDIKRGQIGRSELSLSSRWKWSRGKVRRFIKELEIDQKIIQQIVQHNSVITICNYDKYQGNDTTDETTDRTTDGQLTDNRRYTNKNDKNEKKNISTPEGVSESVFNDFKTLRRTKKAPLTETALKGIEREAKKAGLSLQAAIEICCSRGWTGFKAEWVSKEDRAKASNYVEGVGYVPG